MILRKRADNTSRAAVRFRLRIQLQIAAQHCRGLPAGW